MIGMALPSILRFPDEAKLEAALQLPGGFLGDLVNETDWAFVVKAHALVEAGLAELLARCGEARLRDFFRRLPFAGGKTSKVVVARSLALIDEPTENFLAVLSKLRNELVHDARFLRFRLDEYVSQVDQNAFRTAADAFGNVFEELRGADGAEARRALAKLNLRLLLHFAVMTCLAQMHFSVYPGDLAALEAKWARGDNGKWLLAAVLAGFVLWALAVRQAQQDAKLDQSDNQPTNDL